MASSYIPRLLEANLERDVRIFGAVVVTGAKWSGKTTTCKRFAGSIVSLQDRAQYQQYRAIVDLDPKLAFKGDPPVMFDEWQMIPELWDAARYQIDQNPDSKGLVIFTGSVTMDSVYDRINHSGAGRFAHLRMRTLSLYESGKSTGEVSLSRLFEQDYRVAGLSTMELSDVAREVVRGGWPETVGSDDRTAHRIIMAYCDTIVGSEVNTVDGKRRDESRMRMVMRSLSRNIATPAKASTIQQDVKESENVNLSINTIYDYLRVLNEICVIDDLPAWTPRLRSKTAVRTGATRYLVDPAIAAYFLGAGDLDLLRDPETFGLLFESMVVRDLRIYAQTLDGEVYHYRDEDGLEVDAIVHLWDGRWGAVEVKLGPSWVDKGAETLKRFRDKVSVDHMFEPSFLTVIVPTGVAYTRPDGVHVVPLTCLRN